jgi:hypothetical protein
MAGFRKAKPEQAALKIGLYGPPGSGKTMTALLVAEGLAKIKQKRFAFVDTEHGTDFYAQHVAARHIHPEPFDFDALYTRSLADTISAIRGLKEDQYCAVVVDSITHMWEAALQCYTGKLTKVGTIPMHAWGKIKKPYKDMMSYLLSSPLHVIICGRQKVVYEENEETEELQAIGVTMRAEGETPYEPHILIRMEAQKPKKTNEIGVVVAYAEKDRTGVLAGQSFINPTFETLCSPLLILLGEKQADVTTDAAVANDSETLSGQSRDREAKSQEMLRKFSARIELAKNSDELRLVGLEITPTIKAQMLPRDVAELREKYQSRETQFLQQSDG